MTSLNIISKILVIIILIVVYNSSSFISDNEILVTAKSLGGLSVKMMWKIILFKAIMTGHLTFS